MKVVCESCHAKYQVPDARVAGKKLKIRCKRCGETVLIRGDLELPAAAEADGGATTVAPSSSITGGFSSAGLEWHVSVDGQVEGPFTMPELLSWLATSAAGWDAYVWREGFAAWVEARGCDQIVTAAGGAPTTAIASATGTGDEHPTTMFQGPDAFGRAEVRKETFPPAQPRTASIAPSARSAGYSQPPRARASVPPSAAQSLRVSQPPRVPSSAGSLPPGSLARSQPPRPSSQTGSLPPVRSPSRAPGSLPPRVPAASSPQIRARAAAPAGAEPDDSVLFSTQNLHQVARSGSQPPGYLAAARPGYAAGDGSGLVDIRALAQLARQVQSVPPRAALADDGRFSHGEESHDLAAMRGGSFGRVDSLSPVTPLPRARPRNHALPIAIFAGFALLAASAFAAIVVTRAPVASTGPVQPMAAPAPVIVAAAAQPVAAAAPAIVAAADPAPVAVPAEALAPAVQPEPDPAVVEPEPAEEQPAVQTASTKRANKRHARGSRTATEDKKSPPAREPKAKDKDKEKAAPPSIDDVMLADSASSKPKAEDAAEQPPAASEKSADLDDLLGAKPAKAPEKPRSIDDLLDGAVDKKTAATESLSESPSREQTLSAMRGIESGVRACAAADGVTGTALVAIDVAGSNGRVENADVSGVDGATAACIAKLARSAKFPRFSKPTFSVKYPYRLK